METRAVVTRAAVGTRAVRSPTRSFARATGRPAAAAVTVTFIDEWTSELIGTSAEVDETALAVAAACGAIELTDEFCLEGRCGSCSMRRNDEDDVLLGCRTLVGENDPTAASVLFRIGGATTGPRFDDTTTWSM
jgi:hypothetical protein